MRILSGKNDTTIIDDTYNSSPVAASAALLSLKTLEGGRKIALLGDMLELGEYAEEEHRHVGRSAAEFVDLLVLVGTRAAWIASAAKESGLPDARIHQFGNSLLAGEWLSSHLEPGDIVLAKGSQGSGANMIRMERAVKVLMAHPEDAPKLLVRQEAQWLRQY
jgi:UDP-N-acetylmuramyl pentapeptide synthase